MQAWVFTNCIFCSLQLRVTSLLFSSLLLLKSNIAWFIPLEFSSLSDHPIFSHFIYSSLSSNFYRNALWISPYPTVSSIFPYFHFLVYTFRPFLIFTFLDGLNKPNRLAMPSSENSILITFLSFAIILFHLLLFRYDNDNENTFITIDIYKYQRNQMQDINTSGKSPKQ